MSSHPETDFPWYHTMELAPGRVTNGYFDTRAIVDKAPLRRDLSGERCLDVGTWDGFWAFEMERRGAAEVLALDVADVAAWDWPVTTPPQDIEYVRAFKGGDRSFYHAKEVLGSRVERVHGSVYDLSPEQLGTFDVVFIGTLLLHLRDPVRALERIAAVTRGEVVIVENVDASTSLARPRTPVARLDQLPRSWWWTPNVAALREMVRRAGLEIREQRYMFFTPLGAGHPPLSWRKCNPASGVGRERLLVKLRGLPHTAVRAVPGRPAA